MITMSCPHDGVPLEPVQAGPVRSYRCPSCAGRVVNLSVLRTLASPEAARTTWQRALQEGTPNGPACPSCARSTVTLPAKGEDPELDVCRNCQLIWFDSGELNQLSQKDRSQEDRESERLSSSLAGQALSPEAERALAEAIAVQQTTRRRERPSGAPDDTLRAGLAMFGVPFEEGVPERRVTPILTWGLAGLTVLVFVLTLPNLDGAAGALGFVPEQALRGGGLTLLSSLLIHEDVLQLFMDLLLLLVFADNVEDLLGPAWFAALVLTATLAGGVAHALLDPFPELALVGSTAAATAAFTYYGLRFPRARIGFALDLQRRWGWSRHGWRDPDRYHWVRVPALAGVVVWLALLTLFAGAQLNGEGFFPAVSGLAGAGAGALIWAIRGARRW